MHVSYSQGAVAALYALLGVYNFFLQICQLYSGLKRD